MVGTTIRSMAAVSGAWLCKKVRHPWLSRPRRLTMYLATIQLDKEPAIMVREPDATMQPAPQDNQLMAKHRVLSFKPHLRLEWRGQDGHNETEQPNHSASLGDSITSSTRMRFSVHTGINSA